MITVTVRHINDTEGARVGWFKPDELDSVVVAFAKYGIYTEGAEESEHAVSPNFIVENGEVVFEILVG